MKKTEDRDAVRTQISTSKRGSSSSTIRRASPSKAGKSDSSQPIPKQAPESSRPPGPEWVRFTILAMVLGALHMSLGVLIVMIVRDPALIDRLSYAIVVMGILVLALAGVGSNLKSFLPRVLRKLAIWIESDQEDGK